jgi:hypothetical protein
MEVVKSPTIPVRKRKPKQHIDKSAKLLSLISRVLKNMYGPARLQELIEDLSARDKAMFLMHYIQPAKQKPTTEPYENLPDEQLEKLATMLSNKAREASGR